MERKWTGEKGGNEESFRVEKYAEDLAVGGNE